MLIWNSDNKFTPIGKWTLEENCKKSRGIRNNNQYLPRKPKWLIKLLNENEPPLYNEVSDVKTFYRHICFDYIVAVTNCIKSWFSQPRHRALRNTYFK